MTRRVHSRWALISALAVVAPACGDDGSGGSGGTEGETETDGSTGTATDTASTDPSATATQTASNSATDSDTSPTTDPTAGTESDTDSPATTGTGTTGVDGTDTEATETGDSTGEDDTTGQSGYSISGTFRRSVTAMIGFGNDGIGDAYIGALVACEQDAEDAGGTVVENADLSSTENTVEFTIEGLEDGTYYIAGFFDDNQNADPNDPAPDMGDFATTQGLGIGCVEVTVDGADVTDVEVVFNFTVPF